jgi:hypothetical protein
VGKAFGRGCWWWELTDTDLDWPRVTACQRHAREGSYAQAMVGFIQWLAPRYEAVLSGLKHLVAKKRDALATDGQHRRTPDIIANLLVGFEWFLTFATDIGVVTEEAATALKGRALVAFADAASEQVQHQRAAEPARRFLDLLGAAIAAGLAHIASPLGGQPFAAGAWGWREDEPRGTRVGWVDGEDLYLEPLSAYAAAESLGRQTGEGLGVSSRTLHKRLREQGHLSSVDEPRRVLTVRRTLDGVRRDVLHLQISALHVLKQATPPPMDGTYEGFEDMVNRVEVPSG